MRADTRMLVFSAIHVVFEFAHPSDENNWPEDIPYLPIPVHTVTQCPYFFQLVEDFRKTDEIQTLNRQWRVCYLIN